MQGVKTSVITHTSLIQILTLKLVYRLFVDNYAQKVLNFEKGDV